MNTEQASKCPHLLIVRHGQTEWNKLGRFQGRSDIGLDPTGVEQANALARLIRAVPAHFGECDVIYTSPLKRCRQTASIVASQLQLSEDRISVEDSLVELSYGQWEGLTTLEVKDRFPQLRRQRKQDRWHFRPPDGESYFDAVPRIKEFIDTIDRPGIVVCHTGVIRILQHHLGGIAPQRAAMNTVGHDCLYIYAEGSFRTNFETCKYVRTVKAGK